MYKLIGCAKFYGKRNENEENELCVVCGKGKDDDHAVEVWVLCDHCSQQVDA